MVTMAERPPHDRPVRLGFVGTGHIARGAHLPALAELAREGAVELAACYDLDRSAAEGAAETFSIRMVYDDYRTMIEHEPLDGLYLCIPPTVHTDVEFLAAERGIALFCEKHQSLYINQVVAYERAIRAAGIISQVGFNFRYYPSADVVRDLLRGSTVCQVVVNLLSRSPYTRYWTARYELCGGTIVENTIHTIDLLRYWLGDIASVSAVYAWGHRGETPDAPNLPEAYAVTYRFASGVPASINLSRSLTESSVGRREVLLVSDGALIEWSPGRVVMDGQTFWEEASAGGGYGSHAAQDRAFVEALRTGDATRTKSPYADAVNSLAAVLGANISAEREGERVRMDDVVAGEDMWTPHEPIVP